ncbi:ABC transporter permease [Mesoplasma seiffertii]|uniref:ABC transporter permease n=1 Tax=Mesoplasma seiffertii TaxID=28224 RepID=UPI000478CD39|nr:ABC transporter permease [Mesoplasma seiffertii]
MQSNFLLMLKQGIKGVFKFRVQFTIILLLSFLATSIITVAISTNRRLDKSYSEIVRTAERFDYHYKLNIAGKTQSTSDDEFFMPIADFVGIDYTGYSDGQSFANMDFSYQNDSRKSKTFINKVIETKEFKDTFTKLKDYHTDWRLQNLEHRKNMIIFDDLFVNQLFQDLRANEEYLQNTLIGKYTQANPDWFAEFLNSDQKSDWKAFAAKNNNNEANEDNRTFNVRLYQYLYYTVQSVSEYIVRKIDIYGDGLAAKYSKNSKEVVLYQFLFGKPFNKENQIQGSEFLIENNTAYETKIVNSEIDSSQKDKYFNIIEDSTKNNFEEQIFKKGYRGILNPLTLVIDSTDTTEKSESLAKKIKVSEIKNSNTFFELQGTSSSPSRRVAEVLRTNNLAQALTIHASEWANIGENGVKFFGTSESNTADDLPITSAFLTHQILAAETNNFDLYTRKEIIVSDPKTQIKYRFVSIDDTSKTTFKILRGNAPMALNEIVISEQYARANDINVGDLIEIADGLFYVSGFAVDTYSFYPTADPDVPLPKSKTGAIVYTYEDTMKSLINKGQGSSEDTTSEILNFFTIPKASISEDETQIRLSRKQLFFDNNASSTNIAKNKNMLDVDNEQTPKTFFSKTNFADSSYSLSWTLYLAVFKIYTLITYISAALITMIAVMSLVVCIIKTINFNAKQIGILKANGATSRLIASSYTSYSFVIVLVGVPLGWIAGTMLQLLFSKIFIAYFSFPTNEIFFDWISIVIAIAIFGIFMALVSFIAAFILVNKPVLQITHQTKKWSRSWMLEILKNTIFKNFSFRTRLILQLSSSGKKPIALLVSFVFIGSVLIMVGLSIPAVALNAKEKYYENINYANKFNVIKNVANAPLGKDAITMWNGHEVIDSTYIDAKLPLESVTGKSGYYENPFSYSASTSNSSLLPRYLYVKNQQDYKQFESIYERIIREAKLGEDILYNQIISAVGNQFINMTSKILGVGVFEQFYGYILNNNSSLKDFENLNDDERMELSRNTTGSLLTAIPEIVKAIAGNNVNLVEGVGWREQIANILLGFAPPYAKAYLSSDSRISQMAFGYQSINLVAKQETLATSVSAHVKESNKTLNLLGLDKSQSAYNLSNAQKAKLYIDPQAKAQLEKVFNNEKLDNSIVTKNGFKVYDKDSNTVTLPILANQQLKFAQNMTPGRKVNSLATNGLQLTYLTKGGTAQEVIPNGAWAYDDYDYLNSDYIKQNPHAKQEMTNAYGYNKNRYLNPFTLDANKFTNNKQFSNDKLNDKAYMFGDFEIAEDETISKAFLRPYYSFNNLLLYLPESKIDTEIYKEMATGENEYKNITAYTEKISAANVPDSVLNGYKIDKNSSETFIAIRPYDISISGAVSDGLQEGHEAGFLFNDTNNFFSNTLSRKSKNNLLKYTSGEIVYDNSDLKINAEVVDNIETYGSELAIMDSDLANLISGLSTARMTQYNYDDFDRATMLKAGVADSNGIVSQFDRYNLKTRQPVNLVDGYKDSYIATTDAYAYSPHYFYNTILSNQVEPTQITSGISIVSQYKSGIQNIRTSDTPEAYKITITGIELLSEMKALVDQLVETSIYVGGIIIVSVLTASSLLIMLVGDIYINQYRRFIIMLRALGYENKQIMPFVLTIPTILSIGAWIAGALIAFWLAYAIVHILITAGIAIPFGIYWWVPGLCVLLMVGSFIGSLMVSSKSARKTRPSQLMSETAED